MNIYLHVCNYTCIYEFIGVTLDVNSLCTSISNQENTEAAKGVLSGLRQFLATKLSLERYIYISCLSVYYERSRID